MVFTTVEILFVSFAVFLVLALFLLLANGGFFQLPKAAKRRLETPQRPAQPKAPKKEKAPPKVKALKEKPKKEQPKKEQPKKEQPKKEQPKKGEKVQVEAPKKKVQEFQTVLNLGETAVTQKKIKSSKPREGKVTTEYQELEKTQKKCFHCGSKAHLAKNCPEPKPEKSEPKKKQQKPKTDAAVPQTSQSAGDSRPQRSKTTENATATADNTKTGRTERPEKPEREEARIFCFNCGKIGHIVADCQQKGNSMICFSCGETGHVSSKCEKRNNPEESRCFRCGKKGHVSKDCPFRRPRPTEGANTTTSESNVHDDSGVTTITTTSTSIEQAQEKADRPRGQRPKGEARPRQERKGKVENKTETSSPGDS